MPNKIINYVLCLFLICCLCFLAACTLWRSTETEMPMATVTPIEEVIPPVPTSTVSPVIYGSENNPYIIAEIKNPEFLSQDFATYLYDNTGYHFVEVAYYDYTQFVDSVRLGEVALAWLPPLTYLFLTQEVETRPLLLTNQNGAYFYGTQFYASADSGISTFFNPETDQNTPGIDISIVMAQFQSLRPCFVNKTSISGYLLPYSLVVSKNITTLEPVFTQSHSSVIRSLYSKGICDFGATFAHIGDPRTSSNVLADLPYAVTSIPIIYRSEPIIPNANLSAFQPILPELSEVLIQILLEFSKSDTGLETLRAASGYNISSLMVIDDSAYNPLRDVLNVIEFNPSDGIGY